jgi:hypothetical protein
MDRQTSKNSKKAKRPGSHAPEKINTRFHPGMKVHHSGTYRAFHALHRIPHEVKLIAGYRFPPCSRCREKVEFELVKANPSMNKKNSPLVHVIGVFLPEAA